MRRRSENTLITILALLGFVCIFAAMIGCGTGAKNTALNGAVATLDAARAGLEIYDKEHQLDMVEKADNKLELIFKITKYRARRALVLEVLISAYKAVAVAALNPTDLNLSEVLKLIKELKDAIEEFKHYKDPPLPTEDGEEEPTITRRTVLVLREASCPRQSATPSSYCPLGRTYGASYRPFATHLYLTTPRSQLALQR